MRFEGALKRNHQPFHLWRGFGFFSFLLNYLFVVASSSSKHQSLWVLTSFGQQVIDFDFVDNHRFWFFWACIFHQRTAGGLQAVIWVFFQKIWELWVCIGIGSLVSFETHGWWTLRTAVISVKVLFLRPVLLGTYLVFIDNLWFWF